MSPPRSEPAETDERHGASSDDFADTLRDIARADRYLGATRATIDALEPLIAAAASVSPIEAPIRLLHIGTGPADIPRAIVQAKRRGRFPALENRALLIRAVDWRTPALEMARALTPRLRYPGIDIDQADPTALPYPNGGFDIGLCSHTLPYYSRADCLRILSELDRVTKTGFVVNDIVRSLVAAYGLRAWLAFTFAGRQSQRDATDEVLRSFTREEYTELASDAGLADRSTCVRPAPIYRALLVCQKTAVPGETVSRSNEPFVKEGKRPVDGEP